MRLLWKYTDTHLWLHQHTSLVVLYYVKVIVTVVALKCIFCWFEMRFVDHVSCSGGFSAVLIAILISLWFKTHFMRTLHLFLSVVKQECLYLTFIGFFGFCGICISILVLFLVWNIKLKVLFACLWCRCTLWLFLCVIWFVTCCLVGWSCFSVIV